MGKKQVAVSLRKPPPPADFDRFVTGGEAPSVVAAGPREAPSAESAPVVATRVGERREVTIYLPQDLARRLAVRCVELDRDTSNFVAEALVKTLDEAPVAKASLPSDPWDRARAIIAEWRARLPVRWPFGIA